MKKLLLIGACVAALSSALAQQIPTYGYAAVSVPSTSISNLISTNLASGWTATTYTTNTTLAYSASTGGFVTNSVISTNTTTAYADFTAQNQQQVALQFEFAGAAATTTNVDITVARSVTGLNYDTANNQTFSFAFNGSTGVVGITNLSMVGYGYGRIVTVFNRSATVNLTNLHVYASQYKFRN